MNAAALWSLATAPGTPKGVQIHTTPPATLSGTNFTTLSWSASPEPDLVGYEVVLRETTAADWTSAFGVGNVHRGHPRHFEGQRAVRHPGDRPGRPPQPVGFPQPAA